MSTGQPFRLPQHPVKKLTLKKSVLKLALGVLCLTFFLDYQPSFSFPPFKSNKVFAQSAQTQQISAQTLPFQFQLPHPGYASTTYSAFHPAIDIATGLGMPIKPIASGTVIEQGYNFWGLGLTVTIDHGNGYQSIYAHMGKIYVQKGQSVSATDFIGEVGLTGHTTGPHTHLEISKDNSKINPIAVLPEIRQQPILADFVSLNQTATIIKPAPTPSPLPKLDLSNQIRASL